MNGAQQSRTPLAPSATRRAAVRRQPFDLLALAWLVLLVAVCWRVGEAGLLRPGGDAAYWLGVAGATMLLSAVALRRRAGLATAIGQRPWPLLLQAALGLGGLLAVLLHTGFRFRSPSAAMALASLLVVAASAGVGLFLHLRLHRSPLGGRCSLAELERRAAFAQLEAKAMLGFAPGVAQRLAAHATALGTAGGGLLGAIGLVFGQAWRRQRLYLACRRELDRMLLLRALQGDWTAAKLAERSRVTRELVRAQLLCVERVAQHPACERLFAGWRELHLRLVLLFLAAAVVHVIVAHAA